MKGILGLRKNLAISALSEKHRKLVSPIDELTSSPQVENKSSVSPLFTAESCNVFGKPSSKWARGSSSFGYTIIEVLIVLAVSGALLVAAFTVISGRQERLRYTQAVVDFQESLQDIFNDVSTGYFQSRNGSEYTCNTNPSGAVIFSPGTGKEQGSNEDCIFVGKLIHTSVGSADHNKYGVYTMVAPEGVKTVVKTPLEPTEVRLLGADGNPGIVDTKILDANLYVKRASVTGVQQMLDLSTGFQFSSLVVATNFPSGGSPGVPVTGNSSLVTLYAYDSVVEYDNGKMRNDASHLKEVVGPVLICLAQDGTGRKSALIITRQMTIETDIDTTRAECT